MSRVTRRSDDLILFRGVGFFPSQIEDILLAVEGTSSHYQIILDQDGGVDTLEIRVEVSDKIPCLDEVRVLETLRTQVFKQIKTALDIEAKIVFVEPRSLRHLDGGKGRVIDRRNG